MPRNEFLHPERTKQIAALADGTPLFAAYYPRRIGECFRRRLGFWNGAEGEEVVTTDDGRLFRQPRNWGGHKLDPSQWEEFIVAHIWGY